MASGPEVTLGSAHVAQNDVQQIRRLIDAHGAALVLYARQWCRDPDDALQEALIDLLRQNPAPDNPVAWLYKTVRRRAMNVARSERRRSKHHRQVGRERESWFLPADDTLDEPIDLEALLVQLPQLEREIVVARIWGDLSLDQIAHLVDRSTSSVHRRYHRALSELGKMISKDCSDSRQKAQR